MTWMVRKVLSDKFDDFTINTVHIKAFAIRYVYVIAQRLAVFSIVVPLAASWLVVLHKQSGFAPHLPIEIFHA